MRLLLATGILLYGAFVTTGGTWFELLHLAYALPLLCLRWPAWSLTAAGVAGLMSLPPVVLLLRQPAFMTLPPNLNARVRVDPAVFPGVATVHRISTDAQGFRVTPAVDYDDATAFRVFAIGGSTTECSYLDDEKTWTHLLQARLTRQLGRKVEVINTGVSGLRADNHLATLEKIAALRPDLVVFLMGLNDWNLHTREHFATPWRRIARYRPRLSPGDLAEKIVLLVRFKRASGSPDSEPVYDDGRYITTRWGALERPTRYEWRPDAVSAAYRTQLGKIGARCRELGLPCLFLDQTSGYGPEAPADYRRRFWMTPPHESYTLTFDSLVHLARLYNHTLETFTREEGHPFCPVASRIAATPENFYDDCHFTERGAARLAELVAGCVERLPVSR